MTEVRYEYPGFYGCASVCLLRVRQDRNRTVVIATELPENPGTSITNYVETLATRVCREYGIEPERLVWIEHYPEDRPRDRREEYSLVTLTWNGSKFTAPQWKYLTREEAEELAGMKLPDRTTKLH